MSPAPPPPEATPQAGKTERCRCGHTRIGHGWSFALGPTACTVCECRRYEEPAPPATSSAGEHECTESCDHPEWWHIQEAAAHPLRAALKKAEEAANFWMNLYGTVKDYDAQKARADAAEAALAAKDAEIERMEDSLSALLCHVTDGKLSKTNYEIGVMMQEADWAYQKYTDEAVAEEVAIEKARADRLAAALRELHDAVTEDTGSPDRVALAIAEAATALRAEGEKTP